MNVNEYNGFNSKNINTTVSLWYFFNFDMKVSHVHIYQLRYKKNTYFDMKVSHVHIYQLRYKKNTYLTYSCVIMKWVTYRIAE